MSEANDFVKETISSIKQQRDELALQMHLGKQEAKEEWAKVQERIEEMTDDYDPVKDAVAESAENVTEAMKLVAREIYDSFDRIRKSLP